MHWGRSESLVLAEPYLYAAPLRVFDITDSAHPQPISTLAEPSGTRIALFADLACLAGDATLSTVDIASPAGPRVLGTAPLRPMANGIASSSNNILVGCDWSGLQVYSVNVPTAPRRVGTYYPDASVQNVVIRGNVAYLTVAEESGLEVLDITDPRQPGSISKVSLPAATNLTLMAGNYACVTGDGLQVIDLGDLAQPVCVGHRPGYATAGLQVAGDLAYVAAGEYGLAIYRVTPRLTLGPPALVGNEVHLSWLGSPGVRLQRALRLSNPDWQDVPDTDGVSSVRLPLPGAMSLFRLVRH